MPTRRVTLADLSRKTGLSQATISMVLTRRADVSFSEETVRLVHKAARELGYVPAGRKRLFLFTKSTVLVVCPVLLNYYYSTVVQAVQAAAAEMRCNTLVYTTYRDPDEEARILKVLAESEIGGVLFTMMPQSRELVEKVAAAVPVVVLGDSVPGLDVDVVELASRETGRIAAEHLLGLGHGNVVCVSTPLGSSNVARQRRWEGFTSAFKARGGGVSAKLCTRLVSHAQERDDLSLEHDLGRALALEAVKLEPGATAIVAINDMLGYGVLEAMHSLGIRVPEDMSVMGLDNDFPSRFAGISLTSVDHNMVANARWAFERLFLKMGSKMEGGEVFSAQQPSAPELVVRRSTAAPRVGRLVPGILV